MKSLPTTIDVLRETVAFSWASVLAAWLLGLVACDTASHAFRQAPTSSVSARESASNSAEASRTASIYASTEGGASWSPSDSGIPQATTILDFTVSHDGLFAAAGSAGIYASRDLGRSWRATRSLGRDVAVTELTSVAGTLFAGTRHTGIFTSRDGGETWLEANQGLKNREIRRMRTVDARVYASTNGGLFVSEDQGASWRHLVGDGQTNALVASRGDLFLADIRGVLRSADQGGTWERVYDQGTPHNLEAEGDTVFAMTYGGGVVRSTDAGRSWQSAQEGLPTDRSQYTFQILSSQGVRFAGQWHGVYVSDSKAGPWRPSSRGIPSTSAVTDLIAMQGTLLAATVPSLPKP